MQWVYLRTDRTIDKNLLLRFKALHAASHRCNPPLKTHERNTPDIIDTFLFERSSFRSECLSLASERSRTSADPIYLR